MSIKIYYGIRVLNSDISKFIKLFNNRCLNYLEKRTLELMGNIKWEKILESAELAKGLRGKQNAKIFLKDPAAEQYFRYLEVATIYIQIMKSGLRGLNPGCFFNAFPYGDYFYIIPEYPDGFTYPKYPKYVEDFSYWNNTDPPDGISYKQFCKREVFWKKAGAFNIGNQNKLTHDLISFDQAAPSLSILEDRILKDKLLENGKRIFNASYMAWIRWETKQ